MKKLLAVLLLSPLSASADGWATTKQACDLVQESEVPLVCIAQRPADSTPRVIFVANTFDNSMSELIALVVYPACMRENIAVVLHAKSVNKTMVAMCFNGELILDPNGWTSM